MTIAEYVRRGGHITCEKCKNFAWAMTSQHVVPGPDKLYHHPSCVKVRSV